jgi:hypothetical protein
MDKSDYIINNDTLPKALTFAMCGDLPKPLAADNRTFWIKAISLIKKVDGTCSYVCMRHKTDDTFSVISDFDGKPFAGLEGNVVEIYPYLFLDSTFLPNVSSIADAHEYLVGMYGENERARINALPDKKVRELILKFAIEAQEAKYKNDMEASHELAVQESYVENDPHADIASRPFEENASEFSTGAPKAHKHGESETKETKKDNGKKSAAKAKAGKKGNKKA